ncbi:sugar transferase [Bordetella pertussis]|uniref:Colanic biosynthesis UDP-glucose lipid carrier transferase n=4 Tax=Bordetella pertussis TaxID=520 RepID=Q45382_BORPT|nr:O-antigen biosynthesis protein WlbG [Bordetella pertussis]ETH40459.1 sugar transferase [Bordetella pertussis H918]ETH43906.1 sugar transferase [Bordetella pertussis H939]ETH48691.1 sugar transferase [Bordetella pertussis H921]ETH72914.1 sugar transferase [Bordetella pertussis STO1-CHLA-0011]ETH82078.1 sugar transferase [Bordetella pertussis STO1-CHOC-0017]ETH88852.1 sugar transferase [Bordetella pertussis STO1-CHOC-0018]ETH93022.1 sugar transferase [Bordetella pertussis STO1-CHOC-0019]ET
MIKRLFDVVCSGLGLLALLPLLALIAIAIKLDSPGPVFFRQERVGKDGVPFRIHKLRSMSVRQDPQAGQITVGADPRITRVGKWIRKWKLDELVQLIDVFTGSMSLVGPRPEVPRYVVLYPDALRDLVLSVRPGITDPASIRFRNENEILGQSSDPERTYREIILPEKLRIQAEYVQTRTFLGDLKIIAHTLLAVAR